MWNSSAPAQRTAPLHQHTWTVTERLTSERAEQGVNKQQDLQAAHSRPIPVQPPHRDKLTVYAPTAPTRFYIATLAHIFRSRNGPAVRAWRNIEEAIPRKLRPFSAAIGGLAHIHSIHWRMTTSVKRTGRFLCPGRRNERFVGQISSTASLLPLSRQLTTTVFRFFSFVKFLSN